MSANDLIILQENSSNDFYERVITNVSSGKVIIINSSDIPECRILEISDINNLSTQLSNKINTSEKGAANGVATLGGDGKVVSSQLPEGIVGSVVYMGTWNANTNTPTIPIASSSNKGHYYVVSIAGSTEIDGITDWKLGDWIISNGSYWEKVDTTDMVTSVNGKVGAVVIEIADIANLQNTLNSKAPINNPTFTGNVTLPSTTTIGSISSTELSYLDGVTSAIQTQLNNKQNALGYTPENVANKNANNGYCGLDSTGKIASAQLPTNIVRWVSAPSSPTSTGVAGEASYDNDYLYICVATNTWKRIPLAVWS